MSPVKNVFSLADITDLDPFRKAGQRIASDPDGQLLRTSLSARVIETADGLRRTELVTAPAVDKVVSPARLFPMKHLRSELLDRVLSSPVVPARAKERAAAGPIIEAFVAGLGTSAQELLSGYLDRAGAELISLVTQQQRRFSSKPKYETVLEIIEFRPTRHGRTEASKDRTGAFKRNLAYEGYTKSFYTQDWFDSTPERTVANLLDADDGIAFWVRLQTNDLPILWSSEGREYNPDFIAAETDGTHWIVEVKMDKEMQSEDVQGKREAAQRWANHVSANKSVGAKWRYLLVSEANIKTAKGSWPALKKLGS
jgi:type III restriction enzyme